MDVQVLDAVKLGHVELADHVVCCHLVDVQVGLQQVVLWALFRVFGHFFQHCHAVRVLVFPFVAFHQDVGFLGFVEVQLLDVVASAGINDDVFRLVAGQYVL